MSKGVNRKVLFLRDISGTRGAPEGKKLADSPQDSLAREGFHRPNRQERIILRINHARTELVLERSRTDSTQSLDLDCTGGPLLGTI